MCVATFSDPDQLLLLQIQQPALLTHPSYTLWLYGYLRSSNSCWSICCLMSLKGTSFNISLTSAGDGDLYNYLLDTAVLMFSKFSVIDSTFEELLIWFVMQAYILKVIFFFKSLVRWSLCNNPWISKPVFVAYALMTFL